MKKKSIGINAVLNTVKTLMTVVFPLITFPYISRILQVDNLGNYNFCVSIINYFILLAGLGVSTYSIREGARYREDREKMTNFASEVFSINIISTVVSYILLLICICMFEKLNNNKLLLAILSISILFKTIGCEWIFNIYEEFIYITLRTFIFQILSLVLLFAFVRNKEDVIIYAIITVISSSGSNFINYITKKKYCSIKFVLNKRLIERLVPILIIFANSIAVSIFVNSDITMIDIFSGDYETGLYTVSSKIYLIVKEILSAMIVVSIPRLSAYLGKNNICEFNETANTVINYLVILVIPAMVGVFMLSEKIILIVSGEKYIAAAKSLKILAIALFCCIFSWFYISCILMPYKQEKTVLKITIFVALVNILLNLFLIPKWGQNAAALTTVIAEGMSMILSYNKGKHFFRYVTKIKDIIFIILGNVCVCCCCYVSGKFIENIYVSTVVAIFLSVFCYVMLLLLGKNTYVTFFVNNLKNRTRM